MNVYNEETRSNLAAHNDGIYLNQGKKPAFYIKTYGCQMNDRDSEMLMGELTRLGYEAASEESHASLIIFNTCCVRESAENKILGHLSRLKARKLIEPSLMIIVCGCMTQQESFAQKLAKSHKYIDIILGTGNRHRIAEFIWQRLQSGKQVVDTLIEDEIYDPDTPLTTRELPHKAGVTIMTGCDNFCSFCIVPHVRGREKSRSAEEILREVQALADDGVKEIMLLGQNVNSYRGAMGCEQNEAFPAEINFAELLRHVCDTPGLQRVRFMTSHPKDFSDELIHAVRDLPKVCKAVHLPLQSGSTRILADMNRKYTKEQYLDLVARLRRAIPEVAITTDIIVAYPSETDEDFADTLDVARQARFDGAFMFIYSKRSGTPAAEKKEMISRAVAAERFSRLTETVYPIFEARNQGLVGSKLDVMVEESTPGKEGLLKGRAADGTLVHFACGNGVHKISLETGSIVSVEITEAKTFYIIGRAID